MSASLGDPRRRSLGRGLSALLGPEELAEARAEPGAPTHLPTAALKPGRFQPRRRFDADEMAGLVESVRAQGILQPILVRRAGEGEYEIVAGERRWRAAQAAQLHEVPVLVRALDDGQALELALVENLQRQDLRPLEEAQGYRRLLEEFGHTQEDLSRVVGKSRSHVANMIRLLELPEPVKALLEEGALSAGHGRALLSASDPAALAREVARRGLNVRQTERIAKAEAKRKTPKQITQGGALARELSLKLGYKVEIRHKDGDRGELILHYDNLDQFDDMVAALLKGARTY